MVLKIHLMHQADSLGQQYRRLQECDLRARQAEVEAFHRRRAKKLAQLKALQRHATTVKSKIVAYARSSPRSSKRKVWVKTPASPLRHSCPEAMWMSLRRR